MSRVEILAPAVQGDDRDYALRLVHEITPEQVAAWQRGSTIEWANESHRVAVETIYGKLDHRSGPLPASYEDAALPIVNEQLERAGVRLAGTEYGASMIGGADQISTTILRDRWPVQRMTIGRTTVHRMLIAAAFAAVAAVSVAMPAGAAPNPAPAQISNPSSPIIQVDRRCGPGGHYVPRHRIRGRDGRLHWIAARCDRDR